MYTEPNNINRSNNCYFLKAGVVCQKLVAHNVIITLQAAESGCWITLWPHSTLHPAASSATL